MHWKFEPLFSIRVLHQRTLDAPPDKTPDFDLAPSARTAERMRRLNWMYKAQPGGGIVFAEKIVGPDGQSSFARQPLADEPFTFLLRLNNPALLNYTAPFAKKKALMVGPPSNMVARPGAIAVAAASEATVPNSDLPSFSGRSRLLYFDNLSAVSIPQPNAPPDAPPLLRLTAGEFAGLPEFASRGPTLFAFAPVSGGAVEFSPLTPSGTPIVALDILPQSQRFTAELADNAYRMKQVPGNKSELIYLTGEQLDSSVFGVIRIFNTATLPALDQNRRYTVAFAEA